MRVQIPEPTLTWSEVDQASLEMSLETGDIKEWLGSPAARYLRARLKRAMIQNQDSFFDGSKGVPPGLAEASVRESYFVGLAQFGRMVLALMDEMRREGIRPEPQLKTRESDGFDFRTVVLTGESK